MRILKILVAVFSIVFISMQVYTTREKSTLHFRIKYDRDITGNDIKYIGTVLESTYTRYSKIFDVSMNKTTEVFVFNAQGRFKMESQARVFNDGHYRAGRLYLMAPRDEADRGIIKHAIARVVVRMILDQIASCPAWLAEGYSLVAGGDLEMFGSPAHVTVAQFSDLGEDYNREVARTDVKELYAKISATMQFFIGRYGDHTVEQMLRNFKTEDSLREVFEKTFNENINVIEKAWVNFLNSAVRRRR